MNLQPGSMAVGPLALQVPGFAPTGLYAFHGPVRPVDDAVQEEVRPPVDELGEDAIGDDQIL